MVFRAGVDNEKENSLYPYRELNPDSTVVEQVSILTAVPTL